MDSDLKRVEDKVDSAIRKADSANSNAEGALSMAVNAEALAKERGNTFDAKIEKVEEKVRGIYNEIKHLQDGITTLKLSFSEYMKANDENWADLRKETQKNMKWVVGILLTVLGVVLFDVFFAG